jgi:hypothetical protein
VAITLLYTVLTNGVNIMSKKIELEDIPEVLATAISLVNKELISLSKKEQLSFEDSKNLISYCTVLTNVYKDYRQQVSDIQRDLRMKSKEEILEIIKSEQNKVKIDKDCNETINEYS